MANIVIVDTSVFLNILDVPAFNQNRTDTIIKLERYLNVSTTSLLLPIAAVIEAGNHIAQLANGGLRRKYAEIFSKQVTLAIGGEAPWSTTQMIEAEALVRWLDEFPDKAMRGISMGDLSIIKEWESACARHPHHRVMIWSLDGELSAYDRR